MGNAVFIPRGEGGGKWLEYITSWVHIVIDLLLNLTIDLSWFTAAFLSKNLFRNLSLNITAEFIGYRAGCMSCIQERCQSCILIQRYMQYTLWEPQVTLLLAHHVILVPIFFFGTFWHTFLGIFWHTFLGIFWHTFLGIFWHTFLGIFWYTCGGASQPFPWEYSGILEEVHPNFSLGIFWYT